MAPKKKETAPLWFAVLILPLAYRVGMLGGLDLGLGLLLLALAALHLSFYLKKGRLV
jgi:hypothetical protein